MYLLEMWKKKVSPQIPTIGKSNTKQSNFRRPLQAHEDISLNICSPVYTISPCFHILSFQATKLNEEEVLIHRISEGKDNDV